MVRIRGIRLVLLAGGFLVTCLRHARGLWRSEAVVVKIFAVEVA